MNILAKETENDLMLYDAKQDNIHILNPTARLIYKLHKEGKSISEIEKAVRANFLVPASEHKNDKQDICRDIQTCLDELREKGVL